MECSMSLRAASSKPLPAPGVPRITPLMVPRALRSLSLTPHAHTHICIKQSSIASLVSLLCSSISSSESLSRRGDEPTQLSQGGGRVSHGQHCEAEEAAVRPLADALQLVIQLLCHLVETRNRQRLMALAAIRNQFKGYEVTNVGSFFSIQEIQPRVRQTYYRRLDSMQIHKPIIAST